MKTSMRCSIAIMMGLVVLGSTIPFASALSPAEVEAQYVAMENAGPDFKYVAHFSILSSILKLISYHTAGNLVGSAQHLQTSCRARRA